VTHQYLETDNIPAKQLKKWFGFQQGSPNGFSRLLGAAASMKSGEPGGLTKIRKGLYLGRKDYWAIFGWYARTEISVRFPDLQSR
jgi:hypothetical protein